MRLIVLQSVRVAINISWQFIYQRGVEDLFFKRNSEVQFTCRIFLTHFLLEYNVVTYYGDFVPYELSPVREVKKSTRKNCYEKLNLRE